MTVQDILLAKHSFVNDSARVVFMADSREHLEDAFGHAPQVGVHWIKMGESKGYEVIAVSSNAKEFAEMCVGK